MRISPDTAVRFGLIGPGRAAARFAEGAAAADLAEVAIVWGRNVERSRAFAERFRVPKVANSVEDLVTSDVDAIYIATHPDSHLEFALAALAAGKHVLCEKPTALNVRQVTEMFTAARRNGLLAMEAMKPPFFPLYRKLLEHLEDDPIGPVGFVRAGHCDGSLGPEYPLHFRELGGGGILGIGPYGAFLALDWLGPLKRVQTMGRLSPGGVDNFAVFQTEHEGGMAQLHTGLDLSSMGDALICGAKGYALIHANWWNPRRATVRYVDGREKLLDEPYEHGGFNYEIAHFCELIRKGASESPVISHGLSIDMARLLEEARRSLGVSFPGE